MEGEPKSGLHGLFVVLYYFAATAFAIATFLRVLNWLDDFLHVPIGIKNNPPEPGLIVQTAALAWWPLLLLILLLAYLRLASRIFNTIPMLLGAVILVCAPTALVGGILGESTKAFFQGQEYFTKTITPTLYIFFLMACVGLGANHCITKWKHGGKTRHGVAGLILLMALATAVCGLFVSGNTGRGAVLVIIGLLMVGAAIIAYNFHQLLGRSE